MILLIAFRRIINFQSDDNRWYTSIDTAVQFMICNKECVIDLHIAYMPDMPNHHKKIT